NEKLQEWENFYNFQRPHASLAGQTPFERLQEKLKELQLTEDTLGCYWCLANIHFIDFVL
ncbi:MAG: hypothetical protein ACM3SR_10380, partial [Ignavibacteriales bacterium]